MGVIALRPLKAPSRLSCYRTESGASARLAKLGKATISRQPIINGLLVESSVLSFCDLEEIRSAGRAAPGFA